MRCTIDELRYKEVIDIADGRRYGFVSDVEFDAATGQILAIIIRGRGRGLGLLGKGEDQVFPWPSIKRFGEDIVLVEAAQREKSARRARNDVETAC